MILLYMYLQIIACSTQKHVYPFQHLSLGFIIKMFLKFRNFPPDLVIKYILIEKKECSSR